MRFIDVLRIAFRMLRTNLLRSLLTMAGMGVAISFIVVLIGFGYGLQVVTIGSIVSSKALFSLDITTPDENRLPLNEEAVEKIRQLKGVDGVSPVVVPAGQVTIDGEVAAVAVSAGNKQYLTMEGISLQSGRPFEDGTREILLSPPILELIGMSVQEAIGKTATLSYADPNNSNDQKTLENLLVVGVISSSEESPALYLPYSALQTGEKLKLTSIKASAVDRQSIITVRDTMTGQGYEVNSLLDTLDEAKKFFNFATVGLAIFGGIALIVASIGMFNTLTIALIERTREIGIMKAIGLTNRSVKQLFLAEAAIIGFNGGLIGIAIGSGMGGLVELVFNQLAKTYDAGAVDLFQYPAGFIIGVIAFPTLLAIVTGMYPAIRASRINPLDALRYE